ncbi:MAG: tetratricopeptide repeat protein [Saprospiraceae bacterium]
MNKQQTILISIFVALFFGMYFGCDYVPKNHEKTAEKDKSTEEVADIDKLVENAIAALPDDKKAVVATLEQQLKLADSDTARLNGLKKLSGEWFRFNNLAVSGIYAEQVAKVENSEKAWMICGIMYMDAVQQNETSAIRQFCTVNAVNAFENAITANPENIENRINLALCYTDNPPQDNPMKGILMLRDLDSKYPSNPKVLFQLARLAMRTNQFDKAIARLEQILAIQAGNTSAICLLADAYKAAGKNDKAIVFAKKCESKIK